MRSLGRKNNRELIYLQSKSDDWKANLPKSNWLVLPIAHHRDNEVIADMINTCLDNGVKYVCALGHECEFVHDYFDDLVVTRRIKAGLSVESEEDFEYEPMTTWHNDFDEGVWFAIHSAYHDYVDIDNVIFLDMTDNGEFERIERAVTKE